MVGEEIGVNVSEMISHVLSQDVMNSLGGLIFILKTAGILAITYLIYLIVSGILSFRRLKKLENIEKNLLSVEKKLDKLLKKK